MSRSLRTRRARHRRKPSHVLLLGAGVFVVLCLAVGGGVVAYAVSLANTAPKLSSLKAPDEGSVSTVYAADGQRLGVISSTELRQVAVHSELPKVLRDATVAIEDRRFYKHAGVDPEGILRAAVKNLEAGHTVEGASTITQQLVRNRYLSRDQNLKRKLQEAKLAIEMEQAHPKSWILDQYLNAAPYGTDGGQSAIGAKAAARMYFDKPVKDLTLAEAALLAGLPQAPSVYSPFRSRGAAQTRRDEVLRGMRSLGMISQAEMDKAIATKVSVKHSSFYTERRESFFFDYVRDELLEEYGARTVQQGGLRVYTTIDPKKQQAARAAINNTLAGAGPSSAVVTINPKNGYIETMASSAEYGQGDGSTVFNLAASGHRSPGSTFKVMALMTALRNGVDPDATSYTSRSPTQIPNTPWGNIDVKTFGGKGAGTVSLTKATLLSDNSVYIQLALDLGPAKIAQTAKDMGITSKLIGVPAESLGGLTDGVSPLEMATAYATIASGGYRNRPTAIKRIVFPGGKVERPGRFKIKRTKVFSDGVTAKATAILEKNVEGGTGTAAQIGCPAAGKTGTTDNNTDAWFVGFTPKLATSVWVGYPTDNRVYMNSQYHGGQVTGGSFPAEIWAAYMKVAKGASCSGFPKPTEPFVAHPFTGKYRSGGGGSIPGPSDPGQVTGEADAGVGTGTGTGTGDTGGGDADTGSTGADEPDTGAAAPDTGAGTDTGAGDTGAGDAPADGGAPPAAGGGTGGTGGAAPNPDDYTVQ